MLGTVRRLWHCRKARALGRAQRQLSLAYSQSALTLGRRVLQPLFRR